jgi:hypothetical protein
VRKVRLWRRGEDLRDRAVLRDLQHGKEGKSRGGVHGGLRQRQEQGTWRPLTSVDKRQVARTRCKEGAPFIRARWREGDEMVRARHVALNSTRARGSEGGLQQGFAWRRRRGVLVRTPLARGELDKGSASRRPCDARGHDSARAYAATRT